MFSAAFWWAIAGIALMISEFAVPGLILFFFGIGALLTALATWIVPLPLTWQISLFILSSLASLFGLRHLLKPVFMGRSSGSPDSFSDSCALTGSTGEVVRQITPGKAGRVQLNGAAWKAVSTQTIAIGTTVEIIKQNNLTLSVKPKS